MEKSLATLKTSIAAATRALATKRQLTVGFGLATNADIALPPLSDMPSPETLPLIRGEADHAAFAVRYHDAALHHKLRPASGAAAAVFDMLEDVRVDARGGIYLTGVRYNLARWFEQQFRRKNTSDGSKKMLATLELQARKIIQQLPETKPEKDIKAAAPLLAKMQSKVGNQKAFAKLALDLIEVLSHDIKALERGDDTGGHDTVEDSTPSPDAGQDNEPGSGTPGMASPQGTPQIAFIPGSPGAAGEKTSPEKTKETGMSPYPLNHPEEAPPERAYHAYTAQFDQVISASALATPMELEHLRRQLDQKLMQFQSLTARLAAKLQRLLLARQARQWLYDQEDGMIDSKKLARIVIHPDERQFYKIEKDTEFRDTVVSLLIDNSGSMRGRPVTIAALSADILSRTLERCGVKVEILGFTTREWKGGSSCKQWIKDGRPAHPGRLNDLRHIVYKSADSGWRRSRRNIALMLKDGILKENIDGEALLWACDRLLKRQEQRRILMVISDGAPVDDGTLSANGGNYLDWHLREVIERIETETPIELVAIGIGHDVTRYYKRAVKIADIDKLGETMTEQLVMLFDPAARRGPG
ncbi:MAG: cobaltochelatase subunit CobT [Pseudomonadota bacterium]|nr:cobaltochelatase subunit CobT [Pseudomonadota bacterium]MDE3037978.1 cobaltochelatase subunit CobT [Pseudomonadota bacterium]